MNALVIVIFLFVILLFKNVNTRICKIKLKIATENLFLKKYNCTSTVHSDYNNDIL